MFGNNPASGIVVDIVQLDFNIGVYRVMHRTRSS